MEIEKHANDRAYNKEQRRNDVKSKKRNEKERKNVTNLPFQLAFVGDN